MTLDMVHYQTLISQVSTNTQKIMENSFSDTSTSLSEDFITSHSFSQSSQILKVEDSILTMQSPLRNSCHIEYIRFWRSYG